ncbi:MAG: hypothetical protein LBG58_03190 [Planctomycetaceae bacterium]|jgi:Mg2+/Co2+ transporter CorB|nr:hypothetical protein [Planctomycetaceae bacterium]
MPSITTTLITLVLSTLGVSAAKFLLEILFLFLAGQFCIWIAMRYGEKIAEEFGKFLDWLNRKIVSIGATVIKKMVKMFKSFVLGMKATYEKKSTNTVECTREIYTDIGNNQVEKTIETTIIPWDDVPKEIRNKMIEQQVSQSILDEKQFVLDLTKKRAEEEKMPEIMEMLV